MILTRFIMWQKWHQKKQKTKKELNLQIFVVRQVELQCSLPLTGSSFLSLQSGLWWCRSDTGIYRESSSLQNVHFNSKHGNVCMVLWQTFLLCLQIFSVWFEASESDVVNASVRHWLWFYSRCSAESFQLTLTVINIKIMFQDCLISLHEHWKKKELNGEFQWPRKSEIEKKKRFIYRNIRFKQDDFLKL